MADALAGQLHDMVRLLGPPKPHGNVGIEPLQAGRLRQLISFHNHHRRRQAPEREILDKTDRERHVLGAGDDHEENPIPFAPQQRADALEVAGDQGLAHAATHVRLNGTGEPWVPSDHCQTAA